MSEARQDPAFYTNEAGAETVWQEDGNPFYVVRAGEMRIHARHSLDQEQEVIRYTDRLERFGVTTDEQLQEWTNKGDEYFSWVNNSWFEVYTDEEPDFFSEPMFELDEAIEYAKWALAHPEEIVRF